jgi:hypothetical protein
MTYAIYALILNALVNKIGVFILAAMSLYFGLKLISRVELQKLLSTEAISAQLGPRIKIAATRLLPGSLFIVAATVMTVIAYKSEVRIEMNDSKGDGFVGRGLGPEIKGNDVARARLLQKLDTVLGILNTPASQIPEADVQALKDARPDLERLKKAVQNASP